MNARVLFCLVLLIAASSRADDWPQLAHDPARTSRSSDPVAPPYHAKWIWLGRETTLPGERLRGTQDYPFPEKVDFTFAARVQPIAVGSAVYVPDMGGHVYAISLDDGHNLWTAQNSGGSCASAACADNIVIVTSIPGAVTAFDANTGERRWRKETPKAITASP